MIQFAFILGLLDMFRLAITYLVSVIVFAVDCLLRYCFASRKKKDSANSKKKGASF
jgi:hypothetical protein